MSHDYDVINRHFFEMVRFDFVIDENLKVWLMEVCRISVGHMTCHMICLQVNLSPNMSSGHTHRNRLMYEQVHSIT